MVHSLDPSLRSARMLIPFSSYSCVRFTFELNRVFGWTEPFSREMAQMSHHAVVMRTHVVLMVTVLMVTGTAMTVTEEVEEMEEMEIELQTSNTIDTD